MQGPAPAWIFFIYFFGGRRKGARENGFGVPENHGNHGVACWRHLHTWKSGMRDVGARKNMKKNVFGALRAPIFFFVLFGDDALMML